jgi:diguanylate cyclase (GGDEF)-like protein/PAS domain S-box-containing protein
MRQPPAGRLPATAANALFGVVLAGTLLYLVPTLALHGAPMAAVAAAVFWLGGLSALWLFHRREIRRGDMELERERAASELYRHVIEHGAETYLVLDPTGRLRFASPNLGRRLDVDTDWLEGERGAMDLIRASDRRRVAEEFAKIRRQPGASVTLEVGLERSDGREVCLEIRATNLIDEPAVRGVLLSMREITPRRTFEGDLQHLAYFDALTGLANRRFFFEQGRKALGMARRRNQPACVLSIDLDRFKQVNDLLGYEAGDALLKQVADGFRRSLRDVDIVARLDGDQFAIILTEVRDVEAAGRAAHRILDAMPLSAMAGGHEVPVAASVGLAIFPDDGQDLEALLTAADRAMIQAKTDSLGIQYYRPALREMLGDRLRLEQDMRRALERHEFQLHYQPVFQLNTGAMVGAEALSRWRHFTRGMVAAAEFIELAETSGLIRSLDRWAIARAVHQRMVGLETAFPGWVAVNLSPQSLADSELPTYVRDILAQHGMEPGSLVLEVPDSAVGIDPTGITDLLWKLKDTGAAIALDNFGAGSTSFAQLRDLPIDIVKLDAELAASIGRGENDERVLEGAVSIARGLRARVLAKGVERADQVEWLREAGCDFIQGYFMSRPVPAEDLADAARTPANSSLTRPFDR